MLALYQSMVLSPDLTSSHADELTTRFQTELKEKHEKAVGLSNLGERVRRGTVAGGRPRWMPRSLELLSM